MFTLRGGNPKPGCEWSYKVHCVPGRPICPLVNSATSGKTVAAYGSASPTPFPSCRSDLPGHRENSPAAFARKGQRTANIYGSGPYPHALSTREILTELERKLMEHKLTTLTFCEWEGLTENEMKM